MVDSFLGQAEEGNKTALLKLQLIGHYIMGGDFSITDLSHEMNLSVPTVTKLVSELIEEGFVHDFGKQGTAGGRRPNIYGLNPYAGYFVGVDIKKDIITLAIINFKGQVVDMRDCVPFVMENSVQALDRLCDVVNGFIAKSKIDRAKIFSVGFNLSGRVNSKTGYSYSYFFVEEEPLTMLLEKRLGCKVYVENDTRAMTYGEYMCGVGNNEDTMIFVNASWGLGVGLVIDRKLFYGRSGFSGEFGHFPLLDNEVICRCGKRGCLETGASGSAVHRIFMEKLAQKRVSMLSDKYNRGEQILLEDILETRDTASGIETLNFMEPQSAADLIRDEHPQIIATILVHLKRAQAADILALFDERLRHDVMLRIATFGGVQPAALAELTEVLNGLLDGQNLKRSKMGGVRTAAEIINLMKTQQEEAVITAVREFDGELAQKIIDEMFLFENLVDVDDRSIQRLLQEVDSESLLIALKGAEQPLREKFLRNMSQRAADILRDDLANRGPVRLSQVENEQKAILLIVRRLAETGEMVIGSGEDTYV